MKETVCVCTKLSWVFVDVLILVLCYIGYQIVYI